MPTVTIQGTEYELQPFTAGQLRHQASAKLAAIDEINDQLQAGTISPMKAMPEMVGNCCDLVHLSLSNKYPDLSLEEVESLPFADIQKAVEGVAVVSGLAGEIGPQKVKRSR
jgi:hypothetical protein